MFDWKWCPICNVEGTSERHIEWGYFNLELQLNIFAVILELSKKDVWGARKGVWLNWRLWCHNTRYLLKISRSKNKIQEKEDRRRRDTSTVVTVKIAE